MVVKQRLIVFVMVLVCVAVIGINAFSITSHANISDISDTGIATHGTTAGGCEWELNGTELTISGEGSIGYQSVSPWGTDITKVIINEGVTTIGYDAFSNCKKLTSVTLPDTVTFISDAFKNCTALTEITIPDSVTTLSMSAFSHCASLKKVVIGNSIPIIEQNTFYECSSLEDLTIGESVVIIKINAFPKCASLKNITIPANVKSIEDHAFGYYYDGEKGEYVKYEGITICGYKDTAAEKYALENGFVFNAIEDNPEGKAICGDADCDGDITILDATAIQRYLAELPTNKEIGKPIK